MLIDDEIITNRCYNQAMNILLVDDSQVARVLIQKVLSEHRHADKFNFFNAENGQYALEMLSQHKIDVMFLDWHMPVMDGEELINLIRESKKYSHIKIIIASAEDSKDKVIQMLKKKVNGYLIKPFEEDGIMKAFDSLFKSTH